MSEQLSLFPEPETKDGACAAPVVDARAGKSSAKGEPIAGYASVVVDIPARAIADAFAYAVPAHLADEVELGCTVLVAFGRQMALGYVVALADALADIPGTDGLASARVKPIRAVLAPPSCADLAGEMAFWMSREYVAPLAECLRLFLPPGGTPRLVRGKDGTYRVERQAVPEVHERVVALTADGQSYRPPQNAHRQRQLIEALACGPVSTRELRALYTDMSATVRALAKKGVVSVTERRAWRGTEATTSLSSARAAAPAELTQGQANALAAIGCALDAHRGDVVVIDGVTGSGKTEVYLAAIERVLAEGRSACVLVPEISLTAQTVGRFRSRFGDAVAVFHSRLSPGERLDQWDMVRTGAARVVVGARSALFCPFRDLGLMVIDEEHEQSYKQGSSPRYHAREVAAEMARRLNIPLVLGSATPSAEALERTRKGEWAGQRWQRVEMRERPGGATLPTVTVADLRREFSAGRRSMFSAPLERALLEVAERREKAVLLHNRRGFAPFLMCRECGCVPTCQHCSTALTYHERTHTLECHTCGAVYHVRPYPAPGSACPQCGSRYLAKMGMGTQQVEDALRDLLPPHVEVIRMDADSTRGKDGHQRLLEAFDAAECAVLLGTQMIAKGLDFPEVTLVGVVNADYALKMPDFRAGERAFDLLEQVAGRAGRGERPGEVIIQTYLPHDPVIRAVATHDRSFFTEHDRAQRAEAVYPPFVRLSNVTVWAAAEDAARSYAEELARDLRRLIEATTGAGAGALPEPAPGAMPSIASAADARVRPVVLGPAPCVIARAKDRWRFHVVIKSPLGYHISDTIAAVLDARPAPAGVSVSVDVDAYDLM
ncbi:primosomal protein N' [Collinsella sp. An307]|uniref:replication restart helicase PriA n=1 Tax=Collinsella sp. An307 TaxID=1965630 RepID=UPI000B3865DB|nr:primosomal protein N' [Collinsella sp. An307]OUO18865.1 primosomal protein N' [Collinsella sp. An307]